MTDAAEARFRLWPVLADAPAAVWLLCAVQLLLGGFYALAVPLLHGPDEHSHIDLVNALEADAPYPEHGTLKLSRGTLTALDRVDLAPVSWRVAFERPWPGLDRDDLLPRDARPTWDELGGPGRSDVHNHVTVHPPLYHSGLSAVALVTQGVVRPAGQEWPWDRQASFLRLLNALLLAPLPLFAWAITRRLVGPGPVAVAAAVVPLTVPQLSHLAGSVNNDNLLTLLTAALTLVLVHVAQGDLSRRAAVWAGALAGLAILTKGFALAAPLWIAAAYAVTAWRARAWRPTVRPLLVAAGATVVAGGWWQLRLLITEGRWLQRLGGDPAPAAFDPEPLWWAGFFVGRFTQKFWGFFGIEQVSLPVVLIVVAQVLALVGLGLALWRAGSRAERAADVRRRDVVIALAPMVTTGALVVYGAWQGYVETGLTTGIQGRYLFLGIAGWAAVLAIGWGRVVPPSRLPSLSLGFAAVMQAFGAYAVVTEYWAGANVVAQLRTVLFWSPWPPELVVLSWIALFAAGATVAWQLRPARVR